MTDYKPGQLAKATVRGVPDVTVMHHEGGGWFSAAYVASWRNHDNREVTDVRPLVVLDLGEREAQSLVRLLRHDADEDFRREAALDPHVNGRGLATAEVRRRAADQIEAQTRPAIEEPKGLGAVVEDDNAVRYVRGHECRKPWDGPEQLFEWFEINAVRVLSPGVEP